MMLYYFEVTCKGLCNEYEAGYMTRKPSGVTPPREDEASRELDMGDRKHVSCLPI